MSAKQILILTAAMAISAGTAQAAVVVEYSGDYVSASRTFEPAHANTAFVLESSVTAGNMDYNGDADTTDYVLFRALNLTAPWSDAMGANYSGPAFYGGFTIFSSGTDHVSRNARTDAFQISNSGASDRIRPVVRNVILATSVFLFNTSSVGKFESGAGNQLQANVSQLTSATGQFIVRAGGSFYISQSTLIAGSNTIDPATINWAAISLTDGQKNLLLPASPSYTVAGSTLTNITQFGYVQNTAGNTSGSVVEVDLLRANISLIPEPAMSGVLALGAAGLLARRRRMV